MRECASVRRCVSVHPQVRVSCVFTNFPFFWESQDGDLAIAPSPPPHAFPCLLCCRSSLAFCWHYQKCFIALPLQLLPSLSAPPLPVSLPRMHMCSAFSRKIKCNIASPRLNCVVNANYLLFHRREAAENAGKREKQKWKTHIFWKTRTWDVQLLAISGRTAPKK